MISTSIFRWQFRYTVITWSSRGYTILFQYQLHNLTPPEIYCAVVAKTEQLADTRRKYSKQEKQESETGKPEIDARLTIIWSRNDGTHFSRFLDTAVSRYQYLMRRAALVGVERLGSSSNVDDNSVCRRRRNQCGLRSRSVDPFSNYSAINSSERKRGKQLTNYECSCRIKVP